MDIKALLSAITSASQLLSPQGVSLVAMPFRVWNPSAILLLATALLTAASSTATAAPKIKVACVGASITAGAMIEPAKGNTYPDQLQSMLGDAYEVGNLDHSYGHSGTTVMKPGDHPYWNVPEFQTSSDYNADKYIILLGTNDTKSFNWGPHHDDFVRDCTDLIHHYQNLPSHPTVYVCLLPPILHDGEYAMSSDNLENGVNPAIKQVAASTGAVLIDAHAPFIDHPEYFVEGVHPNAAGAKVLAETVY